MPEGKNKKVIELMKNELGGKTITKFVGLRAKAYSYLLDDSSADKKAKSSKKCLIKRKFKFENYKNCLEATQLENKIHHLQKNKIDKDSFFCYKREHKEFIRKNKSILTTQQKFKSERHNIFTEEITKVVLISNDDKIMQSIESIEPYAYGMSKDLVREKEDIKRNNIIKQCKND